MKYLMQIEPIDETGGLVQGYGIISGGLSPHQQFLGFDGQPISGKELGKVAKLDPKLPIYGDLNYNLDSGLVQQLDVKFPLYGSLSMDGGDDEEGLIQQLDVKFPLYGSLSADGKRRRDKHTPTVFMEQGRADRFIG